MGGQRHARSSRALCHPYETTINFVDSLGRSRRERGIISGGWYDITGSRWRRLGGGICAPLNQFQTYIAATFCRPIPQNRPPLSSPHPSTITIS